MTTGFVSLCVVLFMCCVKQSDSFCNPTDCQRCNTGYWGVDCQQECISCTLDGCNEESGLCFQCELGLYGVNCDKPCPDKCMPYFYEDQAKAACNRHTGDCSEGCQVGFWGEVCQYECGGGCQGPCYSDDGTCIHVPECASGECTSGGSVDCTSGTCTSLNVISSTLLATCFLCTWRLI